MFIIIIPTIGAGLIAASRIMDARHHPFDVITGSLLGVLCAFIAYRQYFPAVSEPWKKGRAYPIRSWGHDSIRPSAYEGMDRQDIDAQAGPRRTADATRHGHSESQADLASHAAPVDANAQTTGLYPRRQDEWESESEEDVELQQSYPSTTSGILGVGTAYVPRAHLATTTAQYV